MTVLDRWLCWLTTRHGSALKQYERERMYLQCGCGWRSPGWHCGKPNVRAFRNLLHVRADRRAA